MVTAYIWLAALNTAKKEMLTTRRISYSTQFINGKLLRGGAQSLEILV